MQDEVKLFGRTVCFNVSHLVGRRSWRCVTVDCITQQVCDSESKRYTLHVTSLLVSLVEDDCVFHLF